MQSGGSKIRSEGCYSWRKNYQEWRFHGGFKFRSGVSYSERKYNQEWILLFMEELYSEVEVVIHGGRIIKNKCCYTWKKFKSGVEVAINGGSIIKNECCYTWRKYNEEWRFLFMEEV